MNHETSKNPSSCDDSSLTMVSLPPPLPSGESVPTESAPLVRTFGPANITDKAKPRRRIVRRRRNAGANKPNEPAVVDSALLQEVLQDSSLPSAYNLELNKTLETIHKHQARHVALQMPEGLLMYACILADVLKQCLPQLVQHVSILGDVTYGACCVDDLGARALGAELLVHYGHSCLVPIQHTVIPCLYVFVEIQIDVQHMVQCVIQSVASENKETSIALLGTIQFRHALVDAQHLLMEEERYCSVVIPQAKPLSPGEVLGCTSPHVDADVVIFCADGRFHLESTMISNPHVSQFLRYDPYSKKLTDEKYDHCALQSLRSHAIRTAQQFLGQDNDAVVGIVLGTLGRQGNPAILQRIRSELRQRKTKSMVMLLSEVTPQKLAKLPEIHMWVQIACPRLSVDWGHYFGNDMPVLSPYEFFQCCDSSGDGESLKAETYLHPMDYYSNAGGPWSNYYDTNRERQCCKSST